MTQFLPREPAICGAEVRAHNVLRELRQLGAVDLVLLCDESTKSELASESAQDLEFSYVFDINRHANTGIRRKIGWSLDPNLNYPHGLAVGTGSVARLGDLARYDLLWFFRSNAADMFPTMYWPRSVVDIDDVQSTYYNAVLSTELSPSKRISAMRRRFAWRRRERLLGERFNVLAVCTHEDRAYLNALGVRAPIHVIPNGFERPQAEPTRSSATRSTLGFIGRFDHRPNAEGIQWFVKNCWPRIKAEAPSTRLRMVGPGSNGPLAPSGQGIEGLGWLADPSAEINSWTAMVVPIRTGAGTRVKIAQALSAKCPIVSTVFGALGYDTGCGHGIILGDSAEAFAGACLRLIRDPGEAARLAELGWAAFLRKWTWDAIRPLVREAAQECLKLSGPDLGAQPVGQSAATRC
ncbi:MAG TPA: glycosyltransferase family 4 protein [Terriglobales bacterium]|nr:glycosyltransferase family 4 protein [Terriglobales bacterium]